MKTLSTILFFLLILSSCKKESKNIDKITSQKEIVTKPIKQLTVKPDSDNGGLFLPDGFGALVIADSVGRSRHLAVNNNGDVYVKLRIETGKLGNIAFLRHYEE